MSFPPLPPTLDSLGNRTFSFYPPILGVEHNEWRYREATWSEILVTNAHTNSDLWVPRRFLGEVSRVDEPVVIVGLNKELEFKAGSVFPHQRRVIEMPMAVNDRGSGPYRAQPAQAPITGIRLDGQAESKVGKLLIGMLLIGVLATLTLMVVKRDGDVRQRAAYSNLDQGFLDLRYADDATAITIKLGKPAADRMKAGAGEIQYRAMSYPDRGYTVLLMGTSEKELHYIGTVDKDWNAVHSVAIPSGGDTGPIVRSLASKRF